MIIAKIGPLSIATVWRQFQVIDYAMSLPPLPSLCRGISRIPLAIMDLWVGHTLVNTDGGQPPSPWYSEGPHKKWENQVTATIEMG